MVIRCNTWIYMVILAMHVDTWQYMLIHGSTWQYIVIHGNTWLSMAIHGHTWLNMAIYGHTWLYLAKHGIIKHSNTWLYIAIHCKTVIHGYTRPYMVIHGSTCQWINEWRVVDERTTDVPSYNTFLHVNSKLGRQHTKASLASRSQSICELTVPWRLTTTPGSTSPTLFEQWCGFFYVPQVR